MTRILSVVTPVGKPVREHLAAAYASLRDQLLPPAGSGNGCTGGW